MNICELDTPVLVVTSTTRRFAGALTLALIGVLFLSMGASVALASAGDGGLSISCVLRQWIKLIASSAGTIKVQQFRPVICFSSSGRFGPKCRKAWQLSSAR